MKGPILALCLLLLVSAAAATGNNNQVNVLAGQEASGNCLTGAGLAQVTVAEANLFGNNIDAIQFLGLEADDNCLTGFNDGETNLVQVGEMLINDTGCNNFDLQVELLAANENCLTVGNITQITEQSAEGSGNNNAVVQVSAAVAGVVEIPIIGIDIGSPNCLTNSDLSQVSTLDTCVTGSDNLEAQVALQAAFDNCLTGSDFSQQSSVNANILGCNNNGILFGGAQPITGPLEDLVQSYTNGIIIPLPIQLSVQYADNNCLTDSMATQMNYMDEQVTGSFNEVGQFALTGITNDCVTSGSMLQISDFEAVSLGCNNIIGQSIGLNNDGNCITGGSIIQQAEANTDE